MKQTQIVPDGTLARMRSEVARALERRQISKCIEMLQRMNRLRPAEPAILLELGRLQGVLYNYKAAEEALERAYQIAPLTSRAAILGQAAQLACGFFDHELAERYFRRAIAHGATPEIIVSFAEMLERHRRIDEARDLVQRALRIDAANPAALLAKAHLEGRTDKTREAQRDLRNLLERTSDRNIRVRAGYELGKLLDRESRYREAMEAFVKAKSLLMPEAVPHLARRRSALKRVTALTQSITPDILRRWVDFKQELRPVRRIAFLGGYPRSGTTLLEQILDSHSDVVSAEETDHFQDYVGNPLDQRWPVLVPILTVLESAPKDVLLGCRESYFAATESCIQSSIGDRLLIDKNPSLTSYILMMIRVFPEISLLVALRDPRDVVVSCFMQSLLPVHAANATWLELETAVEDYISVMTSWRAIAPMLPNPHAEVRYEDLVVDMESTARRVLEFLGVNWDEDVLNFDEHA